MGQLTALTEGLRRDLSAGEDPLHRVQAIRVRTPWKPVRADGLVARIGEEVFRLDVARPGRHRSTGA